MKREGSTLVDVSALVLILESELPPDGPVAVIPELDVLFTEGRLDQLSLQNVLRVFDRYRGLSNQGNSRGQLDERAYTLMQVYREKRGLFQILDRGIADGEALELLYGQFHRLERADMSLAYYVAAPLLATSLRLKQRICSVTRRFANWLRDHLPSFELPPYVDVPHNNKFGNIATVLEGKGHARAGKAFKVFEIVATLGGTLGPEFWNSVADGLGGLADIEPARAVVVLVRDP